MNGWFCTTNPASPHRISPHNTSKSPKKQQHPHNTNNPPKNQNPRAPAKPAPGGVKYKVYRIICSGLSCG